MQLRRTAQETEQSEIARTTRRLASRLSAILLAAALLLNGGCSICKCKSIWLGRDRVPCFAPPRSSLFAALQSDPAALTPWELATVKFDRGEKLALANSSACVDEYYD
ncbi:MAG: hypothetical protein ACKO9H_00435, partial [Planctomycetota bacterium]